MSDEELHFYYFTLHDYDQNKKLDGLEILYAINDHPNGTDEYPAHHTEEEGAEMVDKVLRRMDQNSDGYIDYPEYTKALEPHHVHENSNPQWLATEHAWSHLVHITYWKFSSPESRYLGHVVGETGSTGDENV